MSHAEAVAAILTQAGVTFTPTYIGMQTETPTGQKPWQHDLFSVTFAKAKVSFTAPYKMGLGNRRPKLGSEAKVKRLQAELRDNPRNAYLTAALDAVLRPHCPVESVLHSLLLDSQALHQSFKHWCDDFGYDDDTISALNTYQACCKIGEDLRKLFDQPTLQALQTALEDY